MGALLIAGCGGDDASEVREVEERAYRRGQRLMQLNRPAEALDQFMAVIEERKEAPESHLEAGIIYLNHLEDPVAAIYHLRVFLELKPDAEQSPQVRQMIETARKDFARSLPANPFGEPLDRVDLLDQLNDLQRENEVLRARLAAAQARVNESISVPPSANRDETTTAAIGPTRYTVKPGDTLSRISREVYGEERRWQDIFNANRDVLENPADLTIGQELRIPRP